MTKRAIADLGQFGLIDRLTENIVSVNRSTVKGAGDDCAVIDNGNNYTLLTTDILTEGVDFDLSYFPLQHLGYKAVVVAISDILAMNGTAEQLTVALGVSAKFSVESLDELYRGIRSACEVYGVDLVGGDTNASMTGLVIAVSATGRVDRDKIVYRSGARVNDLVCVTGDMGAAYMGLHLLERERRVFEGQGNPQPHFDGYEYLLRRWLKPEARKEIVEAMELSHLVPNAMIDVSDGLASDMLQICKSSNCGVRLYLDRIAIARQTHRMAEELNADPVVAALNGGGDYELLFTVPVEQQQLAVKLGGVDVIGYITAPEKGKILAAPDGSEIEITAPGFKQQS